MVKNLVKNCAKNCAKNCNLKYQTGRKKIKASSDKVRTACYEITSIAKFLKSRNEIKKSISDWHIMAAVLDRILLIIFSITLLVGSFIFYSEVGRNPVPDHPFKSVNNHVTNQSDYDLYRGCDEYHTGAGKY